MMLSRNGISPPKKVSRIRTRRSKKTRIILWSLAVLIIGSLSWLVIAGIIAFGNIQAKNDGDGPAFFRLGGNIDPNSLNEGDTRINTLIIGADSAAGLTDSIQIFSIDPINSQMAILGIPRDLYVDSPLGGKSKINEIYNAGVRSCRNSADCDPAVDAGAKALKNVIKESLGVNIHYFARVDFQGFKGLVDAIGGVTITVEKALSDPGYPCDHDPSKPCGYSQSAGTHLMNGTQALRYTRCRNGNCGNDFGRAARQQQVIEAIRGKILSLGVLSNPQKINNIISTLGKNLRTDMKLEEVLKISQLNQNIDPDKSVTAVLDTSPNSPLRSANNGAYIIYPKAGVSSWSAVKEYVTSIFPEPYIIKEAATIAVIDASGKAIGKKVADSLEASGYSVLGSELASSSEVSSKLWSGSGNPFTKALLQKRTGATLTSSKPTTSQIDPDFILIIGSDYKLN